MAGAISSWSDLQNRLHFLWWSGNCRSLTSFGMTMILRVVAEAGSLWAGLEMVWGDLLIRHRSPTYVGRTLLSAAFDLGVDFDSRGARTATSNGNQQKQRQKQQATSTSTSTAADRSVRPTCADWWWSLVMFSWRGGVDRVMSQTVGKGLFDHGEILDKIDDSLWRR